MSFQICKAAVVFLFMGCNDLSGQSIDQCRREALTKECIALAPLTVTPEEWRKTLDACDTFAYHLSIRKTSEVPLGCRAD